MKSIFAALSIILVALIWPHQASGQLFGAREPAAKWTATAAMTSKTDGVITLTATIAHGWHIYGLDVPEEAPVATEIVFSNTGIRLSGKMKADPKPKVKFDDVFGVDVSYWEQGTVTLTQPFKVTDPVKMSSQVKITYIGCSGLNCAPPETVTLDIPLKK